MVDEVEGASVVTELDDPDAAGAVAGDARGRDGPVHATTSRMAPTRAPKADVERPGCIVQTYVEHP